MGSLLWHPHPCTRFDMGVDEMSFPNNFLSKGISKLINIFQDNFLQENFSAWPEKVQRNFLVFQYTMEVLMHNEKTQEDPRKKYSDYPSA